MLTGMLRKTEKNGKKSCRGSVKAYTDQEETTEVQEKRIKYFKKKGDRQFTEDGRGAEITIDLVLLVLQAKAKMSEIEVNGFEDAVASEMMKQLPLEKICNVTRCFQECFVRQMEAPISWKIVKLVFFRKKGAEPRKGSEASGQLR